MASTQVSVECTIKQYKPLACPCFPSPLPLHGIHQMQISLCCPAGIRTRLLLIWAAAGQHPQKKDLF